MDRITPMKIRRRFSLDVLVVLLVFIATIVAASAAEFTATGNPRELKGAPGIYEWTFTAVVGKSPFDKIALHRLAKGPQPPEHPDAVVLYLPGTNMNGEVALEDPKYSFQVYLAEHGVDVWSMDYRTHFVPAATAESDLAELKGWTNDLFESDIDAAVKFVSETTRTIEMPSESGFVRGGPDRLFVAGFSRGVEFAYLYAARHPSGSAESSRSTDSSRTIRSARCPPATMPTISVAST